MFSVLVALVSSVAIKVISLKPLIKLNLKVKIPSASAWISLVWFSAIKAMTAFGQAIPEREISL